MALLEMKNVTMRFGGLVAVDDLSLHVDKGEIVSLIGPNGAGKTTVFNMVTGVYSIPEGEIYFDGQLISQLNSREIVKRGVSRTFQNIRLFGKLRTIENALIGAHIHQNYSVFDALLRTRNYKKQELETHKKALEVLESIGLKDYVNDYAANLPYGVQRRLEIARAIMTGAKILLLDEPAAGMNPQESEDLMDFIKSLRDKGYTIFLIEHDMNVVMNISDRVYVVDYGKLIAHGKPDEIKKDRNVIRAYLGSVNEGAEGEQKDA